MESKPDPASAVTSTHDLLTLARGGDPRAVDQLCARYLPRLRRWARARLPRRARGLLDTEDLAQEVLLRTIRHVESIQNPDRAGFHAYLRQVLENRVRDEVRRVQHHPEATELDSAHQDPDRSPLESLLGREETQRYEAALLALDPTDREAVVMRIELRASHEEIAQALGKPSANAARMTVVRALERLVRRMTDER